MHSTKFAFLRPYSTNFPHFTIQTPEHRRIQGLFLRRLLPFLVHHHGIRWWWWSLPEDHASSEAQYSLWWEGHLVDIHLDCFGYEGPAFTKDSSSWFESNSFCVILLVRKRISQYRRICKIRRLKRFKTSEKGITLYIDRNSLLCITWGVEG